MACYLTIDECNHGTMYMNWSRTPLNNALASYTPPEGTTTPAFKFNNNGGKSEVLRQCYGGVRIKSYFRGWCEFIKAALRAQGNQTGGVFTLLNDNAPNTVGLYFTTTSTGKVWKAQVGAALPLAMIDAFAAVDGSNTSLEVKTMCTSTFLTQSTAAGYSLEA